MPDLPDYEDIEKKAVWLRAQPQVGPKPWLFSLIIYATFSVTIWGLLYRVGQYEERHRLERNSPSVILSGDRAIARQGLS